jgi:hypothetical protein
MLGCQTTGRVIALPRPEPPLAEGITPPSYLTPHSQHYRLAVRPFVDQTGKAAAVSEAAADVLVTALHARERFSLYDSRDLDSLEARPAAAREVSGDAPGARAATAGSAADRSRAVSAPGPDVYARLRGVVDGVLESFVTAIQQDGGGSGHIEVDYRIVDPYSRMVVTSGSARIGISRGGLVRKDFQRMASAVSRPFVDPGVMKGHDIAVRELDLEGNEVRVTLDGGSDKQVERGFVGFVIEEDLHARVDRYLAKFVVVNVFPEAAIGVVVDHCNAVGRCRDGEAVAAVTQAKAVAEGAKVRFK